MSLTDAQNQAVAARGNVLVIAGAGTGKTRTLVERCLDCLVREQPRVSLEEILLVTFTDVAAAEMRQRIRNRLEEELEKAPGDTHWSEQLGLFETAHIGTLHGFCLKLVREHFYELGLDPQLTVLAENEAHLLAEETLDDLLQEYYADRGPGAQSVRELIQAQGGGQDQLVRTLVMRLHHYSQTLPDPEGWLAAQQALYAAPVPVRWRAWLAEAAEPWQQRWLPLLETQDPPNDVAARCRQALIALGRTPGLGQLAATLEVIQTAAANYPPGKKGAWIKPLEAFLKDAGFLAALLRPASAGRDPLAEDWDWARGPMGALIELARRFSASFSENKRELGVVDFHDLEQHALQVLWDRAANGPTGTARQWRRRLRFVFVDEYQDINAAQDKIIEALSRAGAESNRFLVGDVKQSIYRFRLANPHIFQAYAAQWHGSAGLSIPLVDNFRSREGLVEFFNSFFGLVMQPALGGLCYDEQARLRFGAPGERAALGHASEPTARAELLIRLTDAEAPEGTDPENGEAGETVLDLIDADKEARLVAKRLLELKNAQYSVWDEDRKQFRPIEWTDMAILLRAPSRKAESYAKEFSRLGVPLQVARGGFYESLEVSDLLSLLQVLDNPLQDLPVLAVLHSPLVGLSVAELAAVRLAALKAHFWTALLHWEASARSRAQEPKAGENRGEDPNSDTAETWRKVSTFLKRFNHWRRLARQTSLSRCLEAVLDETHYGDWLLTQSRGEQRQANVQRLLALAQDFDRFQRQGLFRFLRFIEAQQEAETQPEAAPIADTNAVRLMSIHHSKGLEFPLVVVADLGKPFNFSDLRSEIILDEEFGLCPQIKPPHTGKRYPSLPYWLAQQRQTRELLGEELRLLYVAMTRARDTLILSAGISSSRFEKHWSQPAAINAASLARARAYADWVGLWFAHHCSPPTAGAKQGEADGVRWTIHDDSALLVTRSEMPAASPPPSSLETADAAAWEALKQRLSWTYPHPAATRQPAKTSVTLLRRRALAEAAEEAAPLVVPQPTVGGRKARKANKPDSGPTELSAAEAGTAHHRFLQLVSLERAGDEACLRSEVERLRASKALSPAEADCLDLGALYGFWNSPLGKRVRAQAPAVRRELSFTARLTPEEISRITGLPQEPGMENEFIVVQGVADLAVILPGEIWLVDFKTDDIEPKELEERVKAYTPQMKLYAHALAHIFNRSVSEGWLCFLGARQEVKVI